MVFQFRFLCPLLLSEEIESMHRFWSHIEPQLPDDRSGMFGQMTVFLRTATFKIDNTNADSPVEGPQRYRTAAQLTNAFVSEPMQADMHVPCG